MEHVGADLSAAAPFDAVVEGRRIERFATQDGEAPTLGEVLLNPTQIYVDPVIDLLKHLDDGHLGGRSSVRGLCHVTGGGLSNLLRLHPTLGWRIDAPYPCCPNCLAAGSRWGRNPRDVPDLQHGHGHGARRGCGSRPRRRRWLAERMPGSAWSAASSKRRRRAWSTCRPGRPSATTEHHSASVAPVSIIDSGAGCRHPNLAQREEQQNCSPRR